MEYYLFLILSYIIGSIPFGLCLCKIWGYGDIRTIGSGNIGATNVLRTGNKTLAFLTLILDAGKGALMVLVVLYITDNPTLSNICGVFTVIGHNFPIWLRFKGGKGIATSLGTVLAIDPIIGGMALGIWILVAGITRFSSLAGIISMLSLPIIGYSMGVSYFIPLLVLCTMSIGKHIPNIKRLIQGTESKISLRKQK